MKDYVIQTSLTTLKKNDLLSILLMAEKLRDFIYATFSDAQYISIYIYIYIYILLCILAGSHCSKRFCYRLPNIFFSNGLHV